MASATLDRLQINEAMYGAVEELSARLPVVLINDPVAGCHAPFVAARHDEGFTAAVNYLLALGHRRIAFVGGQEENRSACTRRRAYADALTAHGVAVDPRLVHLNGFEAEDGAKAMARLLAGENIPTAVILALSLNYTRNIKFKKTVQMMSYFPYFISTIVIASMINMLFNTRTGVLGRIYFSLTQSNILADPNAFAHLYVWSGVWQGVGFGAIIYLAALSSVDPQLHEAATIDGANVLQRIWHIDLPTIAPMVTIMLILNMGSILGVGYEKVLAMQNQNNLSMSEVISTYSYKVSLAASMPDFAYGTAIGLFQSLVGLVLVMTSNKVANKLTGNGFW